MNRIRLTAMMILFGMLAACSGRISEPSADEARLARDIGGQYAAKLKATLKDTLQTVIQQQGLAAAVGLCNEKALPLTRTIESDGVTVKRTATRLRNQANAPSEAEMLSLAFFENASGDLPADHVQKVREDGGVYYYYYQPLLVGGICLACHGDPANMSPDLRAMLAANYPDDRATGYKEGDFRGVIRVKIPAEK